MFGSDSSSLGRRAFDVGLIVGALLLAVLMITPALAGDGAVAEEPAVVETVAPETVPPPVEAAQASPAAPPTVGPKVTICHRTSATNNPYGPQAIEVDQSAIVTSGHSGHTGPVFPAANWGDIIPPFTGFPGLNWDAAGMAIWNNDCQIPTTTTTTQQATTTTTQQATTTTQQATTTTQQATTTTTQQATTTTTQQATTTTAQATTTVPSGSIPPDPGGGPTTTDPGDVGGAGGATTPGVGGVVVIPATQPAGQLARTGSQSGAALLLGGVLVVVGLLVVRYTRPS